MNRRFPALIACLFLGFLGLAAPAAARPKAEASAPEPSAPPAQIHRLLFKDMTGQAVLPLRTTEGSTVVNFGARADELVTRLRLRLRYTASPALIPGQSHIKILLNDETVGIIPIGRQPAGQGASQEIDIDPRLVADFNRLKLLFIGHYTAECEDPLHSSLWTDISGLSELEVSVRPLAIRNDLSFLPEPFFDRRDLRRLDLPFVFAAAPSTATVQAAGTVASWFGTLAAWRGARFPVHREQPPRGNAVVFATNGERPAFLASMPAVAGPTLSVVANPADGAAKLLLVQGRDSRELGIAARALVLGHAGLSGSQAVVKELKEEVPRQPYDAPNWVRLDRPMKFGELVASPQELQVFGHVPDAVRLNLRIPPDLFTWRSRGVPVDLKYRYSPPIRASESRLSMSINDELVQSFNLRSSGQGGESARIRLPLLDDGLQGESQEVFIPAFKLGSRNQLQFNFSFAYQKEGHCRDTLVENVRAMVDADSQVDFSGYPHYAEMPHLGYFATSGFPFTKYADLSNTVAVLPESPTPADLETLFALLARLGESTGYPGTRLRVAGPGDEAALRDADLLVIGAAPRQSLLQRWSASLPAAIAGPGRRIAQPVRKVNFLYDWLGFGTAPDPAVASQAGIEGDGPLAAMLGFESPVTSGRSVVAVTAVAPEHLSLALDALEQPTLARGMYGSAVFIHPQKVESFLAGNTYVIGELPWWTALWFPLSGHPVLLACMAVLAVLILAFALWRSLRAVAAKRMESRS